jgi:hypothetical protein
METQTKLFEDIEAPNKAQHNLNAVAERIKRLTYPQNWTPYNLSQTQERVLSERLLLELLSSFDDYIFKNKRSPIPMQERIYCMFAYIYCGFSSRRLISELTIAKQRGILKKVVHFNSVLNYFSHEEITPILRKLIYITSLPLKNIEDHVAVDSTGFSTSEFSRWVDTRTQKLN